MRTSFVEQIRRCADAADRGKEACIRIKVKHLADERTFESIMEDTRWSWALRSDGTWERVQGNEGKQNLHGAPMRRARVRARRAGGVPCAR
jgi:hypothetical protein